MQHQIPVTVFYDASCSLCNSEMQLIELIDSGRALVLIDCSAPNFDDTPYREDGVTREAMMQCLHLRDNRGAWVKGAAAFELIYFFIGMPAIASLWGGRMARKLYPWVARHRRIISSGGMPMLFKLIGKYAAWRANRRSGGCRAGRCSIDR